MDAPSTVAALRVVREACAKGQPPHAAIVDISLGRGGGGIEAAQRIREVCGPRVALIFLTGVTYSETIERARKCNPVAVLTKPVPPGLLVACVRGALDGGS